MAEKAPSPPELWRHPNPEQTPMYQFMTAVNEKHGLSLSEYEDLHRWSVEHLAIFWADVWDFVGITASRPYDIVLPSTDMFPRPDFFQGSRLNFAENLLFPAGKDIEPSDIALITVTEEWPTTGVQQLTWSELRERVRQCAARLRGSDIGLTAGDVVAGFVGNHADAIVTMLATASVGAVWTSISPDNGVSAVLDRLVRVKPKVLFADDASLYNGKLWPSKDKTLQIVEGLSEANSLRAVIVVDSVKYSNSGSSNASPADLGLSVLKSVVPVAEAYTEFLGRAASDVPLHFEQLPPSHPLYILYSSGTTGLPKAIVHTAMGTLIQHKKELALHCSMGPHSRMLYYTTTSWMMWHWSVSALSVGSSLVLYMGSPFKPYGETSLPRLLANLEVTHFGTSAAYLVALEAKKFKLTIDLPKLEAIYSTASPLPPSTFAYVYETFHKDVHLSSITGGTDIISLFGAPCPLLPVVEGTIQCAGLGMAIAVADSLSPAESPTLVELGDEGDLVCLRPFPCQPLTFYDGDAKYRAAYFERFHGWWHHGDLVRLVGDKHQYLLMLGRSDGILKPSGVRFGSAEIYNVLIRFFAKEVEDSLCVGRRRPQDTDETVCLFILRPTTAELGARIADFDDLRARIKATIRRELSPRHVPGIIEECIGIPRTGNGKK